jgi:hypothetical protein
MPVSVDRSIVPKWTTYHTPRQEIIDAMPKERICPASRYTTRALGIS